MDFQAEYRSKLRTPAEAVRAVKNGDWVDYTSGLGFPPLLDAALAARRDELHDVKVRGNLCAGPVQIVECDRIQCICTAGKIYDRCIDCTGNPVFRCIPDLTEDIYRTESSEIYQEVLPGYGLCILNSNIKCNDSAVNRYPDQEGGCI